MVTPFSPATARHCLLPWAIGAPIRDAGSQLKGGANAVRIRSDGTAEELECARPRSSGTTDPVLSRACAARAEGGPSC